MKTPQIWRIRALSLAIAAAIGMSSGISNADGKPCGSWTFLALPNTTITVATVVPAGVPPIPGSTGSGSFTGSLPVSICRMAGAITYASPSNIRFEVWMPIATWNENFNGVGGAGLSGFLNYAGMAVPPSYLTDLKNMVGPIGRGYATATTDTGHEANSGDLSWARGHTELVIDFTYLAHHLTAQVGKAIVTAPEHSYFTGCSNGGGEALSAFS